MLLRHVLTRVSLAMNAGTWSRFHHHNQIKGFHLHCRDCRRVARFKVGQNIFRARDNRVEVPEWRHVIRSFFSEISLFPGSGSIARFKYTPGTGHYTQMVWSRVTRVGCGLITYYNDETAPLIARYMHYVSLCFSSAC